MAIDKSENTQVLLTISKELLKLIEDYQFDNRIPNRSEAIRELIQKGLDK
ncbi:ribbon-helix-helix domain-containing protein [Jeotgalibaca porci]